MEEIPLDPGHPLGSLAALLKPHRARLLLSVLVFAVKDCPLWLLPLVTSAAVDIVVKRGAPSSLGWLSLAAVALLLQNYPMHLLFTRLFMGSVRSVGARLRNLLARRLQVLSMDYHARSSASVTQSKIVRDVENIELMLSQAGSPALSAFFVFAGAIVTTAVSVPQFLPVFALSVPCGVAVWWLMRRGVRRRNEEFRRDLEAFSARVGEMAALIPVTRAHGLEEVAVGRVREAADRVRERGVSLDMLNGRFGAASWVTMQILSVGCLLVAAALALLGLAPMTPGQVVLLSTYFSALTGAVTTVLSLVPLVTRGAESIRSAAEIMQDPDLERNDGKLAAGPISGRIELRRISASYPGAEKAALVDVSLAVEPGQTVAFVGPSGSGKSTLMNTILGFVRPRSGRVILDGRDLAEYDLRTVRRQISVVPQESVLFAGTVFENVTYGLGSMGHDRVRQALADANALDFVEALPEGWDTMLGERGAKLSGGQRQRLSLARALIRDPRILILDEATSALDSESESHIQAALEGLRRSRTTLVVAHRLSTVRGADRIVVMERGRVAEEGTHSELLALGGRYARAWNLQQGGVRQKAPGET
ncbi:ABC transporter ATP-binding protein [Sinomonas sp. JGH33]|uniref:ABC transporter ATP-binding protein n=1 Tax=Sinomonas terricola TaxID=3110330 RepID=A0ABU5T704_9MICC|nr:ABC transporter ATP-binding protein [Sinomonas sp. JGH33]MEA5455246.1 ABC transporter ATP-binding protein [Sinomonas sp. JGH33]